MELVTIIQPKKVWAGGLNETLSIPSEFDIELHATATIKWSIEMSHGDYVAIINKPKVLSIELEGELYLDSNLELSHEEKLLIESRGFYLKGDTYVSALPDTASFKVEVEWTASARIRPISIDIDFEKQTIKVYY
jgi:hypothetical protein